MSSNLNSEKHQALNAQVDVNETNLADEFCLPLDWKFDPQNPVRSIEQIMLGWKLEFNCDASIVRLGAPLMADRPESVSRYLDAEPLSVSELSDEILLASSEMGTKV